MSWLMQGVSCLLLLLLLFLVVLHVRGESGCRVIASIADGALEGLAIVVRFHVDLEVIAEWW